MCERSTGRERLCCVHQCVCICVPNLEVCLVFQDFGLLWNASLIATNLLFRQTSYFDHPCQRTHMSPALSTITLWSLNFNTRQVLHRLGKIFYCRCTRMIFCSVTFFVSIFLSLHLVLYRTKFSFDCCFLSHRFLLKDGQLDKCSSFPLVPFSSLFLQEVIIFCGVVRLDKIIPSDPMYTRFNKSCTHCCSRVH